MCFFGIVLKKVYLIGCVVSIFENRKKCSESLHPTAPHPPPGPPEPNETPLQPVRVGGGGVKNPPPPAHPAGSNGWWGCISARCLVSFSSKHTPRACGFPGIPQANFMRRKQIVESQYVESRKMYLRYCRCVQ